MNRFCPYKIQKFWPSSRAHALGPYITKIVWFFAKEKSFTTITS
jgi:hypothetical protein